MRKSMLFLAGLLSAVALPAHADDEYKACIDKTVTNTEWAECGGDYIKREEKKMNEVWGKLMEIVEDETKTSLQAEQEAWEAFRETACQFYADPVAFGREGQVLSFPSCVAETVAARTLQLRDYLREIDP
jgi:uncharacterized protein YecT (DUF1311 family)